LLHAIAGLATLMFPPSFEVFAKHHINAEELPAIAEEMVLASNSCIEHCQRHDVENEIMLWMLMTNSLLISNLYGDTSKPNHISSQFLHTHDF
jgi:hypothetical protein